MREGCLVDFYRGWLIEVHLIDGGFQTICYSPCREKLSDPQLYASDFEAISAAQQWINDRATRHALAQLLRELYEADRLSFEEWGLLRQSLVPTSHLV